MGGCGTAACMHSLYDARSLTVSPCLPSPTCALSSLPVTSSQLFMIKVKGNKKSREVPLLKKKSVHTIGRDKSNMLVIEDSRVSRSHARVEYSDTRQFHQSDHRLGRGPQCSERRYASLICLFHPAHLYLHIPCLHCCPRLSVAAECEYIDLGSSCGSKLNGKPVLRAKLRPGDVIELGQSVLIFQVRKKKTMAENLIAMIKG